MNNVFVLLMILFIFFQKCPNKSVHGLCPVDREERVFIENPIESHGGGVYFFNEKYSLDFKEVRLGYQRNELATKILRSNPSILKDSNTIEILLFNEKDSVWIREDDMFSKERVFMKVCFIERVKE